MSIHSSLPRIRRVCASALLCLGIGAAGCSDDSQLLDADNNDPNGSETIENPLATASVSFGITCGPNGEETVMVITEEQAGCAEHAAVLAGQTPAGTSLVVESPTLMPAMAFQSTASICDNGVCVDGDVAVRIDGIDATVSEGHFSVNLDGNLLQADFEATRCDFGPNIAPIAAAVDIREVALYQATRVALAQDGLPVDRVTPAVAGRPGLLRVFVAPQAGFQAREIRGELTWDRGDGSEPVVYTKTIRVLAASMESRLGSSFDFELTAEDTTLDAKWSMALRETSICAANEPSPLAVTPTEGESLALAARDIGNLKVVIVPIQYQADGSGRLPDTSEAQLERYRSAIMAQYPVTDVEVSVREPMVWGGAVEANGAGWSELLQELLVTRARDRADAQTYYYGAFEPTSSFRNFCRRGCVLGLGPVAGADEPLYRGVIGLGFTGDDAANTAVHEIGHAHGRLHAPCGVDDADPNYPHSGGGIGEWGYDLRDGTLKSPGVTADFMSYCDPAWVSDYTYGALAERVELVNHTQGQRIVGPEQTWRTLTLGDDVAKWGGSFETNTPPAGTPVEIRFLDSLGATLEVAEGAAAKLDHFDSQIVMVPPAPEGTAFVQVDGGVKIAY